MSTNIIFNTTTEHLEEIENWLIEALPKDDNGFGFQIPIIQKSFNNNKLIVIEEENRTIGFLTYNFYRLPIVNIEIFEIKPGNRRKGIGKKLLEESCKFFEKNHALVAQLHCSIPSSLKFWKKMGFKNFPNGIIKTPRTYLYKILVESAESCNCKENIERIELSKAPVNEDIRNQKWIWEIKRKEGSNELLKPIIQPSGEDWPISHIKNGEIMEKSIMKNFDSKKHDNGYFLIIQEFDK